MDHDLAPCPFCDGRAEIIHERVETDRYWDFALWWKIRCSICGISLSDRAIYQIHNDGSIEDIHDTVSILIMRWNRGRS